MSFEVFDDSLTDLIRRKVSRDANGQLLWPYIVGGDGDELLLILLKKE